MSLVRFGGRCRRQVQLEVSTWGVTEKAWAAISSASSIASSSWAALRNQLSVG